MAQNLYSYSKWTGRLVAILEISIWVFVHSLDKQLKIMFVVHIFFPRHLSQKNQLAGGFLLSRSHMHGTTCF